MIKISRQRKLFAIAVLSVALGVLIRWDNMPENTGGGVSDGRGLRQRQTADTSLRTGGDVGETGAFL